MVYSIGLSVSAQYHCIYSDTPVRCSRVADLLGSAFFVERFPNVGNITDAGGVNELMRSAGGCAGSLPLLYLFSKDTRIC
jgi:hypothetical protein